VPVVIGTHFLNQSKMTKKQVLGQLQHKLRIVYWRMRNTATEWEKQLLQNELHSIQNNINYLQSILSQKP
jgi:hypothetical protein